MATMKRMSLERYVNIIRGISDIEFLTVRELEGTAGEDNYLLFKKELSSSGALMSHDDDKRYLHFSVENSADSFFGKELNDLICAHRFSIPSEFYIYEINLFYTGNESILPDEVIAYFDTANLANMLKQISDHDTTSRLIFLEKEKIGVDFNYYKEDVSRIKRIKEFQCFFIDDEIHTDQKKQIIRSVLSELFYENGRKLSISVLANNFQDFFNRVKSGYDLYVSDFSFQKVKSEIEQSKSKFLARINKVISDMQNQMLVVPVSLIAIASSYEKIKLEESMKNFSLLLGGLIFSIFFILLSTNQRSTLMSIKGEIKGEFLAIKTKHSMAASIFYSPYKELKNRFFWQYSCLDIISFIVVLLLVWVFIACTKYSGDSFFGVNNDIVYGGVLLYVLYRFYKIFKDKPWDIGSLKD